ncbi:MAG: hypothetical protein Q7S80_01230 [bacterium]|nr:hypothetical protein [bacterium]
MNILQTKKYAFVLGRERDLCLAELRATLNRFGFCFDDLILSDNVAFINLDSDPRKLIDILGGTTKIFEIIEPSVILSRAKNLGDPSAVPQDDKLPELRDTIKYLILDRAKSVSGKFNFGFSAYGRHRADSLNPLGLNIKKDLKDRLSLRFIAIKEKELSTIVSSKNNLATAGLELGFFNDQIGILIAVTDPEAWSERDYGKPRGDKFSGMVPPKLARAMVNIALGSRLEADGNETRIGNVERSRDRTSNDETGIVTDKRRTSLVVDPFCGSGNILLEAMMLGCDVLGSDVSEKAVNDSRENVEWLLKVHSTQSSVHRNYQIVQADATTSKFTEYCELSTENYDDFVIVCEPYLGEPKKYLSSMKAVRGEYEKIRDLYIKFLANIFKLSTLNFQLTLCLVFPLVETVEKIKFSLYSESVDEIKKIGYTELAKPLVYGRDYQIVKREIVLLTI